MSSFDNIGSTNDPKMFEIILIRNRLHWMSHVARMPDEQPMKALLYGVLEEGSKRVGHPLLRYKDTLKEDCNRLASQAEIRI